MTPLHTDISQARTMAHAAIQLQCRAAKANLDQVSDDSHTSLSWADGAFRTHAFRDGDSIEITLNPMTIRLGNAAVLSLNGVTYSDALAWLDDQLESRGYSKASEGKVTYDMPAEVSAIERFADVSGLDALEAWYDRAVDAIARAVSTHEHLTPGPVRCWPHHFDLASYIKLGDGDPETARGIGIGLSPGDTYYDEPYFYVTPWPHPDTAALPEAAKHGHWHTRDFVGQVATGTQLLATKTVKASLDQFLEESLRFSLRLQDCPKT